MAAVAAGPEGALYVQRQSAPAGSVQPRPYDPEDTAILRFDPATSALVDAKVPHVDGTWLRLHDVGTLAGAEVILYEEMQTPNPGLDAGRLLLLDVSTGDTTVVDDDFGGWEKWSNLFQVADNGLVVGEKVDLTETYPTIYRVLDSAPEITPGSLGLQASYSECSTECARHLTVDPTGTAFAYLWRNAVIWTDLVPQRTTAVDVGPDLPAQVMVTSDAVGVVSTSGDTPSGDSSTSVRILTLDDREIEVPGASVSLYSEVPAPAATDDPDTTGVDGRLVADQRMATEDDLRRLPEDINGTGMVMACSAPTTKRPEYTTDSPIFSGVPSSVHLAAWIAEVNAYFSLTGTVDEVPAAGWTTIVLGPDSWFVLPDADGNWRAIVRTIPWNDSWRVSDAWFCTTDDVPTTETTGPTPVFAPLEDGMPAVTEALGETLTYGSAQEAVDALVAALTRPDGCDVAPTATALELTTGPEEAGYSLLWRYGCDDSSGGAQIEVTVTQDRGGMWTIAAASMATLCLRGVDDTGLCI
jgi:hypothetical protein